MSILNTGLSVNDVVTVSVSLAPTAAQERNFGSLLILGDSNVIDTTTRIRTYSGLAAVAADFGNSPEYQAAALFFGQSPQPAQLYLGSWARTAQAGRLVGSVLGAAAQALAPFQNVTAGTFNIVVDGTPHALTALSFAGAANLSAVAGILTTALGGAATVTWDANNDQFNVASATTGALSSVAFPTASVADISSLFGLGVSQGGYLAPGLAPETALQAATVFATLSGAWYGLMFAAATMPSIADNVAVAGLIAGLSTPHIFGISTQDATVFNAASTADVASQVAQGRTFVQYSSNNPYVAAAVFGIAFTVNFNGIGTTLTLKFQQEGGVTAETLTESQAGVLKAKNCNVFVNYNNGTAILQQGTMSNGYWFDVVQGTDWLQNYIQTGIYNVLLTAGTKVPQTDPGVTRLVATVAQGCSVGVTNGLIAPGVWEGPPIGSLITGQTLASGYYISAATVASQSQAQRASRAAPLIQAAIKLAGAIHSASCILNVNQ